MKAQRLKPEDKALKHLDSAELKRRQALLGSILRHRKGTALGGTLAEAMHEGRK